MSLLSYTELMELVDLGVITNVTPDMVNSASIDLTIGKNIITESRNEEIISLRTRDCLNGRTVSISTFPYNLEPNEFILAHTQQIFNLPLNISAEYKLKSSLGRIGLNHMTSGFCDSGWNGCLTLELKNDTQYHTISIQEGDKIGQMCFYRHRPVPLEKSYAKRGRYNGDLTVSGVKK